MGTNKISDALSQGKVYQSTALVGKTFVGRAIMDVDAPPKIVWNQLLGFDLYPRKVPMLKKVDVYKVQQNSPAIGSKEIFCKCVSPLAPGFKVTYHLDHIYDPRKGSMTWTLDDTK